MALSIFRLTPPQAVPASASPAEFSSGRAMNHLRFIARETHPLGSAEHAKVRAYILKELTALGTTPEVQKSVAKDLGPTFSSGAVTLHNIVARLKGQKENAKAVLLAAHYDSSAGSPGASDDASGVATLLETLRALKSSPPLQNDAIFLFTDGEEVGLLGARAFVSEHPWAKEVGIVLNFEARGSSGPVFMFETSSQNGRIIRSFAKAVRRPVSSSYMSDVYMYMPNSTDLTIFKGTGFAGLNFAYIGGAHLYHTELDNIQNIDERSLQHHGLYGLALAREFGNLDLNNIQEENAVYFDVLSLMLAHYPSRLVCPLTIVVMVLFIAVLTSGIKKRHLTLRGYILGFVSAPFNILCLAMTTAIVRLLIHARRGPDSPAFDAANFDSNLILLGFVALTVIICSGTYFWFSKRAGEKDLALGGLSWWSVLMIVVAFYWPGISHLFVWPLLFSLLPYGRVFASSKGRLDSIESFMMFSLCAIPGIILVVPAIYSLYIGIGLNLPEAPMILLVYLTSLIIPHFNLRRSYTLQSAREMNPFNHL